MVADERIPVQLDSPEYDMEDTDEHKSKLEVSFPFPSSLLALTLGILTLISHLDQ